MDGCLQHRCPAITTFLNGIVLCGLFGILGGSGSCAFASSSLQEDPLLKAAYLYNFAKFTSWPAGTWHDVHEPLLLCTVGNDPLVAALPRLNEEKIGGRRVTIKRDPTDNNRCQMLYIAASEQSRQSEWISSAHSQSVLTISENPGFANSGGMIELFRKQEHLRFRINIQAVRASGLTLSSRLLGLAEIIAGNGESDP